MRPSACFALAVGLVAAPAWANPEPLPFTYVPETLPRHELEIEQYVDFVPTVVGPPKATVHESLKI